MVKKRQSKHTRKAAKQQRSPARAPRFALPPPQTRPAIKISDAILTLAEPLRAHYREPHRLEAIIAIAYNDTILP